MKPGSKLKSGVCDTEIMVIRAGEGSLECGGAAMADEKPESSGELNPDFAKGTQMGKRYVDADGTVEVLCVKPGKGSLSLNGVALTTKEAKSLPSSD
jgi:hypothetical protein